MREAAMHNLWKILLVQSPIFASVGNVVVPYEAKVACKNTFPCVLFTFFGGVK